MILRFLPQREPFMDTSNWKLNGPIYFAAAVVSGIGAGAGAIEATEETILLVYTYTNFMYLVMFIDLFACIYTYR